VHLFGRSPDGDLDLRARAQHRATFALEFTSGATGVASAELYESEDGEDRGGFVLRLQIRDGGCAFIPSGRELADGAEFTIAGDAEACALAVAIRDAMNAYLDRALFRSPEGEPFLERVTDGRMF
jgi:hypothetical protein